GPLGAIPAISLSNKGARSLAATVLAAGDPTHRVAKLTFADDLGEAAAGFPQKHIFTHQTRAPDRDLLEAMATGELGSKKLKLSSRDLLDDSEKVARIREISEHLRSNYSQQLDNMPNYTKVAKPADTKRMDGVIDHLFDMLMSRPTNVLSRSPAFKQFYWRRISEMMPFMDASTQRKALEAARKAGVGRGDLRSMVRAAFTGEDLTQVRLDKLAQDFIKRGKTAGTGAIKNLDDVDEIAKAFALQETKALLYDLTKKTQFFDMTRNIFPFGEAWNEIITTWLRLFQENPNLIRRVQQGIQGARNNGFFYNDPSTGEEVFAMPWLNPLAGMTGVTGEGPSPGELAEDGTQLVKPQFTGRVEGVNLMLNNYLPGLGPLVQLPMAALTRDVLDSPDWRWLRELVFPYGYPDAENPGAIVNSVMPAWFRKGMTALGNPTGDDERLYNNTVIDVLRAMDLNGEIEANLTVEASQEVLEEAKGRARKLFAIRALQQFVGPTGPQVRWDVQLDPDGEAFSYQVLATEYRQMIQDHSGDRVQAFNDFVNT
ncbi:MAG: hypothetical protein LN414_07780, partial [Candidatus Thermoplasmatota archaeon]|nr:hypothetical protein [Candidatus Thermoplasmatota archaeon]